MTGGHLFHGVELQVIGLRIGCAWLRAFAGHGKPERCCTEKVRDYDLRSGA